MKKTLAIVAAWLPFLALWQMFAMQAGATFWRALPVSVFAIGSAAVLGLGVWWFCARTPWRLHPRFYLSQIAGAAVFTTAWTATMTGFIKLWEARAAQKLMVTGWLLEGVWLYAIVAAFSYAILTQQRALRAEKNLAVARLDALRSRLHPHFLFNALHTVGALVRHDPAEAEGAVEKLGDMLRYTLRENDVDAVPFAEEWEFTRRYLEFEQLRYGERLRVTSEIDPRSLACSAPSFALQTLVENSIRHSISRRAEGGRVEISAKVGGDRLHIRVRNDDVGAGFSRPEMDGRLKPAATQNGYGLNALRERLQTVYGSRLNVSRNETGFEVEFSVPCAPSGEDDDDE